MNKNNTKYPLPVGKRFKYQNQEYVVAQHEDFFGCTACEEANAQYIKDNPYKCVALTKTGKEKFHCNYKCGQFNYPKRIK